jgi:lysophospholipase L1-like esterase
MKRYERYVAIGDSTTEGLDDPDGRGGYIGWADRLAQHVAARQGGLLYANLAVRGLRARGIRSSQLLPALALKPDLATVVVGMNDLIHPGFDQAQVIGELEAIMRPLRELGSTVLTFTLPDLTPVMPLARIVRERSKKLNDAFRETASRYGALLLDLALNPLTADPRLWAADRLHANSQGHERIGLALANTLGITKDESFNAPLPPLPPRSVLDAARVELSWAKNYLAPWLLRRARGHSSSDGVSAKRPALAPVTT